MRKAVVLSAGEGLRLRPLTTSRPKVMVPLNGRPLLEHHVEHLKRHGIEEIYINLHHAPQCIQDHFGDGSRFGVRIVYSYEPELRGTAGALNGFREALTETFAVHYGDVVSELDLASMLRFHRKNEATATLAVHPTHRPADSDIVEIDEGARVVAVHHAPGSFEYGTLGNAASYIAEPKLLDYLPPQGKFDFIQDVFHGMLAAGDRIYAYETEDYMQDIGTPERYQMAITRYGS